MIGSKFTILLVLPKMTSPKLLIQHRYRNLLVATNYEGATAAYAAAVGGSLPMLEMLASRGANLDATNLYGDSPLEAAIHNGHASVASFLKAHGASQIQGTPEQRSAASQAIVLKQMERERSR
jgi:ankyrin repeat protein